MPDYVVLFDESIMDKGIDVMAGTSENTVFVVNTPAFKSSYPFKDLKTYVVDAQSVALEALGRDIPNTAMLGALAGVGIVGLEAVKQAIGSKFGAGAEANIKAAEMASRLITVV